MPAMILRYDILHEVKSIAYKFTRVWKHKSRKLLSIIFQNCFYYYKFIDKIIIIIITTIIIIIVLIIILSLLLLVLLLLLL
jgi:hypothetical protein